MSILANLINFHLTFDNRQIANNERMKSMKSVFYFNVVLTAKNLTQRKYQLYLSNIYHNSMQ